MVLIFSILILGSSIAYQQSDSDEDNGWRSEVILEDCLG